MSKNLTLKLNGEAFPNANDPIVLNNYKYSAKRMSNAPTITATVNYPVCLDSLWTDEVYVEFRGERYFLRQTPSSSYDNTSTLYKHSLDLVSERIVLENVYFFDVVREDTEDDKPVSNSSDFSFSGDVKQFAKRFEYSAKWSGLDYTVVVDDDVVLEDKHIQFQDQFLYNALQSMYETYKVPFYFVGKVIHIGYAQDLIEDTFKYGVDSALMSINRNNSGNAIVNRITGLGSDKNITYYYPNPTPRGELSVETTSETCSVTVVNGEALCRETQLEDALQYHTGKIVNPTQYREVVDGIETWPAYAAMEGHYDDYPEVGGIFNPRYFRLIITQQEDGPCRLRLSMWQSGGNILKYYEYSSVYVSSATALDSKENKTTGTVDGRNIFFSKLPKGAVEITVAVKLDSVNDGPSCTNAYLEFDQITYNVWKNSRTGRVVELSDVGLVVTGQPSAGDIITQKIVKRVNVQSSLMPSIYRETDGEERFYNAENGKYKDEDGNDVVFANTYTTTRPREYIHKDDKIYPTIEGTLNAQGLRIDMFSEFAFDDNDNDEIYPVGHEREGKYVHPYFFGKLRKFNGDNGFNLFDHAIEGQPMTITMKSGKCAACEFAIGVDEETSSYNTVQVTEIDKITADGLIPAGSLIRDDDGNVLCGRWPQAQQKRQERQNDTINYEVWIALKKEEQTFGTVMPSQNNNYLPEAKDEFAILNINLPEAYVLAAEKRLEQSAIKYMDENNDYKFNYTAKLSRIYFEQKPNIASTLNENSKVKLQYNGVEEELYVSSYSYSMSENSPLPEVSIELNDEIKIIKGAFERVKNEFKFVLGPTIDKIAVEIKETSNSLSNATRIAKTANETATAAKTSSDKLKVDIKDVGVVASSAKLSAEKAELSATQAKEGITAVGNEVGTLKTTVTSTQNIASKAQLTANNAMSEIGRVSSETTTKFNSVDNSINGIERDVNALEGLIGDEYNIWFENEGQQGIEPTLDNYPASDWTSDDDYFNHDRDLYYSITLGRAWRFMYNNGEPFWEEITDADTITALTKAKEALDKANEAIEAVHDLDYLKAVFGDAEVMNEHAVILSRLLAVSDDYDNVVAGVYGGGVSGLDDNGYKDSSHGTLMMFAGADDAQHASTADFRVYSDGCIFANSGTFGGIMKRAKKVITSANLNDFIYFDANATRVLDLTKTGSFITFGAITTPDLTIRLPWYSSDPSVGSTDNLDDLLSILGTKIIVKFTMLGHGFCFNTALFNNGDVAPQCLSISTSSTYVFECKAGKNSSGTINIGWEQTEL